LPLPCPPVSAAMATLHELPLEADEEAPPAVTPQPPSSADVAAALGDNIR